MKFRWEKKYLYWGITAFSVIAASILFYLILKNLNECAVVFHFILGILTPFITGGVFAYILLPIEKFFEYKVFKKLFKNAKGKKTRKLPRILSIIVTIILALAVIVGIFLMIIPQLIDSIIPLIENMPEYLKNVEEWATGLVKSNPSLEEFVQNEFNSISKSLTDWAKTNLLPQMTNIVNGITIGVKSVITIATNFIVGIVLSIYIMNSREKFAAQLKKISYSIFSVKFTNTSIRVLRRADSVFGSFITGKLTDSLIIGILSFCAMSILGWPLALLISVIIAITNIIPFFGPIIGAVPTALLMLMVGGPLQCLYFIIYVIILQQIDGNLIGPKILGDSTGLSAFWVMFAILVGGGLFGFMGMLIGVPAFAVIYSIIKELVETRLDKKELPVATTEYVKIDHINLDEEAVYKDGYDNVKVVEEKDVKS